VRCALIEAEKANYPVAFMCRLLRVPRSTFYAWRHHVDTATLARRRELAGHVRRVFTASRGTYGCRGCPAGVVSLVRPWHVGEDERVPREVDAAQVLPVPPGLVPERACGRGDLAGCRPYAGWDDTGEQQQAAAVRQAGRRQGSFHDLQSDREPPRGIVTAAEAVTRRPHGRAAYQRVYGRKHLVREHPPVHRIGGQSRLELRPRGGLVSDHPESARRRRRKACDIHSLVPPSAMPRTK
jgi:hypothetical protein